MKCSFKAFSLLEISFVLIIASLLMFGGMKGMQLVEKARVYRAASEMRLCLTAIESFKIEYAQHPCISNRFNVNTVVGSSNAGPNQDLQKVLWKNLHKSGLIKSSINSDRQSPLGGSYHVQYSKGFFNIIVGSANDFCNKGVLTGKQVLLMIEYLDLDEEEYEIVTKLGGNCIVLQSLFADSQDRYMIIFKTKEH
ncbi:hypothetical protein [Candidatus Cytomitobacter primus]|uniref:Type II secretion system protein n=1 Tax=Candidatus Cytomitobacter primus TaxID=2066024 RepID=A0A5C0UFJ6_9PROT|nr:hypothetical protein [Candidatus Cytomitobacter primus]QEK38451.1 hypothetical protein FZC34_00775 [Candidatus Cytomitobacter primus]